MLSFPFPAPASTGLNLFSGKGWGVLMALLTGRLTRWGYQDTALARCLPWIAAAWCSDRGGFGFPNAAFLQERGTGKDLSDDAQ